MFFFLLFLSSICSTIEYFEVSAKDSYDLGFQYGTHFKYQISKYYQLVADDLAALAAARDAHAPAFAMLLASTKRAYPRHFDELRGLSSGAGVSLDDATLLMLAPELSTLARSTVRSDVGSESDVRSDAETAEGPKNAAPGAGPTKACSDVQLLAPRAHGHNEDADPRVRGLGFLLRASVNGSRPFTAYAYPGLLPGLAFGWTDRFFISFNALFPKTVDVEGGLARYFVCRDALDGCSAEDALAKALRAPLALGFNVNVDGVDADAVMENVERGNGHVVNGARAQPYLEHFNNFLRLNVSAYSDTSSVHRLARAQEMGAPTSVEDVRKILGDTEDAEWPIYRDARAPDTAATVATMLVDWDARKVDVFDENPKLSAPVHSFKF